MMKYNLKGILYNVFGDDIKYTDIQSFIYFLKLCGAYNEYMVNLDINILKASKDEMYENNSLITFYSIIACSFSWNSAKDGFDYWDIINRLHRIIIYIKIKKNIILPNRRMTKYLLMCNFSIPNEMERINHLLSKNKIKDKKLHTFISELKEFCKENKFL